ncbi:conjugative transfer ATPase [Pseudomonas aeruginosa]
MGLFQTLLRGRTQPQSVPADAPEDSGALDVAAAEEATERYLARLAAMGIPLPNTGSKNGATQAEASRLYDHDPSFVDLLPWAEYLPDEQVMLLEDGRSRAAFFELVPLGTEGRDPNWMQNARDALKEALQNSFDEHETSPWIVQFYAQDEISWDNFQEQLRQYVHPRARGSAFSEMYLALMKHHLEGISKPGGLFVDTAVSKLPWRGQQRRVRMVVYRRIRKADAQIRGQDPAAYLKSICERIQGGLANAGIVASRMGGQEIRNWLIRWFNPHPDHLGKTDADLRRFYELVCRPDEPILQDELPLADGTDFSQNLFYRQPVSDATQGVWLFDAMPHRVIVVDQLNKAPLTGHVTGETLKGDGLNALFDRMPEDTLLCITMVVTPQDMLEGHLQQLSKKAVGDTQASIHTREDVATVRRLIGREHKLYRGAIALFVRGRDHTQLEERCITLSNVLLGAGLVPVEPKNEVGPLNSYLRWLPSNFDPNEKRALEWYTQMMFAQHIANLSPIWGRTTGTGHPGFTLFNRGGAPLTFDPFNKLDRQMNAHGFIFGPTGSGKSASLTNLISQMLAMYLPRMFVAEAGNSFGLLADFAKRFGLSVHRVRLAPGSGVSLAPFADAIKLVESPDLMKILDAEDIEDSVTVQGNKTDLEDDQRDILGEMEIVARLMITGGEEKEDARLTRADRSAICQAILAAARTCAAANRTVLTQDVRDALYEASRSDGTAPERRARIAEMAEAMQMFCMGTDGEMFNREGTPWPEADLTVVDFATYAREGYAAQLGIAYISLLNTVNNIAERDQFKGRPIVKITDEGHIITKHPLLLPYAMKITKMWRKLGAWFWLATQNIDDIPASGAPMLNMIEWWLCLNMPPDEVEKISRFRELSPAQKSMMLSARKESGKFTEGVLLAKGKEYLFRVVPPSLYLALAMTENEEKNQRYNIMQATGCDELEAALQVAADLDKARGLPPFPIVFPDQPAVECQDE